MRCRRSLPTGLTTIPVHDFTYSLISRISMLKVTISDTASIGVADELQKIFECCFGGSPMQVEPKLVDDAVGVFHGQRDRCTWTHSVTLLPEAALWFRPTSKFPDGASRAICRFHL
jgi:hypothetical protein